MSKVQERNDDYQERRKHLKDLTDEQLYERFWKLAEEIVNPLIKLAETNTSPSIERSILLRMGFDSLQAKAIVEKIIEAGLLGKGAGGVVYRMSKKLGKSIQETGNMIINGAKIEI